jgi:hypothetical protein
MRLLARIPEMLTAMTGMRIKAFAVGEEQQAFTADT